MPQAAPTIWLPGSPRSHAAPPPRNRLAGDYWYEDFQGGRTLAQIFDSAVGTTASLDTSRSHSGTQSLLIHQTGSASASSRNPYRESKNSGIVVFRCWVNIDVTPASLVQLLNINGSTNFLWQVTGTGRIQVQWAGGTSQDFGVAQALDTWHVCDFRLDYRGSIYTCDWKLNGVDGPQATSAASAPYGGPTLWKFANSGAVTIDYWLDDWQISDDWGAYPLSDPTAGGTDWTDNENDSVTMSDALVFDRAISPADSVTMSDALVFDRQMVIADSVTMSDSLAFDRQLVIADSVTMSDNASVERGISQSIADSVTMSDALVFDRALVVADSVTMSDALVFDRQIVIGDSVTMSDNTAANRGISQSIADSVTMGDATQQDSGKGVSPADSVTMSDALVFDRAVTVTDTVTMSDSLAFQRSFTVTDTVTMSDAVAFQRSVTIADSVTMSDLADPVKTSGGGVAPPVTIRTILSGSSGLTRARSLLSATTATGQSGILALTGSSGATDATGATGKTGAH